MFPPIENRLHCGACFSLPCDTIIYSSPTPPFCSAAYIIVTVAVVVGVNVIVGVGLIAFVIVMVAVGALLVFAQGSALAPFIYTIF